MYEKSKIKNFSSFYHLFNFIIFFFLIAIIGYLLDFLILGLIIYLFFYILYIIYSLYSFEKWIFNFKKNKLINYPEKYQYLAKEIKNEYDTFLLIKNKFSELEKRFKELSESMPDAVAVVDKNYVTEWFNGTCSKMLSLKESDIGKPILHLIRNPDFNKFIKSSNKKSYVNFLSPLNYSITLQSFIVPYGEDRFLITFRDVSESDQLDKMRSDFIANVSHELKTPLTVIIGYLEMLSFSDDGYVDDNIIEEMFKQSKRMDSLISDLLKLTKLQTSHIPEKSFSTVNLKSIISELVKACNLEIKKNKNDVKIIKHKDIYIRCSYEEIYSAFLNLLTNAIAYAGEEVKIEINCFINENKEIVVAFQDYGAGIPEESITRLTERFYRIDKSRSREEGGTGLGLSIVKHIMNRHGGSLEITSTLGQGSTFSCKFPRSLLTMESTKSSSDV